MDENNITEAISDELVELEEILLKKNKAYGNSAGLVPLFVKDATQETAIMVRANDKIRRLDNLLKNGGAENDESISDTIRDLAGYCVLWLIARKNRAEGRNVKPTCCRKGAENETL